MAKFCNVFSCEYPCCMVQLRYIIAAICFFAVLIGYCHRAVLNIGITEMVKAKKGKNKTSTCPKPPGQGASIIPNIGGGKVDWSEENQNYILASFFIGYMIIHIPAGLMADRFGARYLVISGFALSTITTATIPFAAVTCPWWTVFIIRVLTGLGQGAMFPCLSSLIGCWIPPHERATVGAAVFAASAWGLVVGNSVTGFVIQAAEDWTIAFYMWSAIGIIFLFFMICYGYSDPRTDKFLTEVEMDYLKDVMKFKQPMRAPIWKIFSDRCTWGLISAQLGHSLIIFLLSNNMSKYMNNVLGFNIKNNALVSFLFIFQWVSSVAAGNLADYLVKRRNANVSWVRKIYTTISNVGAAAFLVMAGYSNCDFQSAIIFFGFGIFIKGIFFAGLKVSIIDVTINHSGFLMSIVNGFGSIAGFLSSIIVGQLAKDNTLDQWHTVYLALAGAQVVTISIYLFTASSERRAWDYAEGDGPPIRKKTKWYLQLTYSEHEMRMERDQIAIEKKRRAAREAKQKLKDEMQARKEARRQARTEAVSDSEQEAGKVPEAAKAEETAPT